MNPKATHFKRAGACLSIAIALIAPAAGHARSGAEAPPAGMDRDGLAAGIRAPAVQRVGSAGLDRLPAVRGGALQQEEAETGRGGLDRRDAAAGAAIFVVVVLMGVWGYVAVGAVIAVVAWLLGAGARLLTGKPWGGHGWSDWPGSAAARVEQQKGQHRPLVRRPERI